MCTMRCADPMDVHSARGRIVWLAALVFASAATLSPQAPSSVWAGVYTTEQAVAGEKIYFAKCAACHGDDLAGREQSPALAGAAFLETWHGKTLRRLIERVEEMPPGMPVTA